MNYTIERKRRAIARCERDCRRQTRALGKIMSWYGLAISLILIFGNQENLAKDVPSLEFLGFICSVVGIICLKGLTLADIGVELIFEFFT